MYSTLDNILQYNILVMYDTYTTGQVENNEHMLQCTSYKKHHKALRDNH